jgi:hypothetical protein
MQPLLAKWIEVPAGPDSERDFQGSLVLGGLSDILPARAMCVYVEAKLFDCDAPFASPTALHTPGPHGPLVWPMT